MKNLRKIMSINKTQNESIIDSASTKAPNEIFLQVISTYEPFYQKSYTYVMIYYKVSELHYGWEVWKCSEAQWNKFARFSVLNLNNKQYYINLTICLVLQHEPNNENAIKFNSLLKEKISMGESKTIIWWTNVHLIVLFQIWIMKITLHQIGLDENAVTSLTFW